MLDDDHLRYMQETYNKYRSWNRTHCEELQSILTNHSILLTDYTLLKRYYIGLERQNYDLRMLLHHPAYEVDRCLHFIKQQDAVADKLSDILQEMRAQNTTSLLERLQPLTQAAAERAKKEAEYRSALVEVNRLLCENKFLDARLHSHAVLTQNDIAATVDEEPDNECLHYFKPGHRRSGARYLPLGASEDIREADREYPFVFPADFDFRDGSPESSGSQCSDAETVIRISENEPGKPDGLLTTATPLAAGSRGAVKDGAPVGRDQRS